MLLDKKPNFTFVEIAAEWAREVAPEPGSLGHNEIFHELVKALWRGDFEDEEGENTDLTMALSPATWPGGKWVDEHHQRTEEPRKIIKIRRRELLYMLWDDCPPGVTLPPRQRLSPFPDPETGEPPVPWSELKTEIPWGALDALTPDEYSPTFRRAYLEAPTISKDDFGRWCDEQGHQRPRFWFGPRPAPAEKEPEHHPPSVDELHLRSKAERDWYDRLVKIGQTQEPNTRNTKEKLLEHAKDEISQRAFDNLWRLAMPDKFKYPGPRKTSI